MFQLYPVKPAQMIYAYYRNLTTGLWLTKETGERLEESPIAAVFW